MRNLALLLILAATSANAQFDIGGRAAPVKAAKQSGSSLAPAKAKETTVDLYVSRNVAPGPKIQLSISTKNVPTVQVDILKLPPSAALATSYGDYKLPANAPRAKTLTINVAQGRPKAQEREDSYYQRQINLPVLAPGFYALRAGSGKGERIAYINVTNLSLVSKVSGLNTLTWVTDFRTGKPIPGAIVEFMTKAGAPLGKGTTNADGVALLRTKAANQAGVVVRRGTDVAALSLELDEQPERTTYFETDRSLYQPGQTVFYKLVAREMTAPAKYRVLKGESLKLELRSPVNQLLERLELKTDDRGVVSGEFEIPSEGALGMYSLMVTGKDFSDFHSVNVQEYRKPEFKVTAAPQAKRYLSGETIKFLVSAETYFGSKVGGATVDYSIRTGSAGWYGGDYEPDDNLYARDVYRQDPVLAVGQATADKDGNLLIEAKIPPDLGDSMASLEVTVADGSRRQVKGSASVPIYGANLRLSIRPLVGFVPLGKLYPVEIRAVDLDGKPKAAKVTLSIRDRVWNEKQRSWEWKIIDSTTVQVPDSGTLKTELPTKVRWSQVVTAAASDGSGRIAKTETVLSVADPFSKPEKNDEPNLRVFFEGREAKVGQTAKGFVTTNRPTPVLVVFEGADLFGYQLLTKSGPISLPVTASMVPRLEVTVTQFIPKVGYRFGNGSIRALDPANQIKVSITPDKSEYAPGDEAKVSIKTLDGNNKPVTADLSLAVVDEALLSLGADPNGPIYDHFWQRMLRNVETRTSMPEEMSGGAFQKRERAPASAAMMGADADAAKSKDAPMRLQFEDTAFWKPSVITDGNGEATLAFPLPGNLTTWRATARGLTETTAAGEGKNNFKATRPFTVRAALPRQWILGDRLKVIVTANNRTDQTAKLGVKFTTQTEGNDPVTRTAGFEVTGKSDGKTNFDIEATKTGPMKVTVELFDEAGTRVDGFQVDSQVRGQGAPWTDAAAGVSLTGNLALPKDRDLNDGKLTLTLMAGPRALIRRLEESIRHNGYWSPDGAAARLSLALRKESKDWRFAPTRDATAMILRTQSPTGWGYWEGARVDPYVTARVATGVAGAGALEANGDLLLEAARRAVRFQYDQSGLPDARAMLALAAVTVGHPQAKDLVAGAAEKFDLMSPTAKLALAEARFKIGDPKGAQDIVDPLAALVSTGASESFLPTGRNSAWTGSTVEANLRLLRLLVLLDTQPEKRDGIANWLQSHLSDWAPFIERALATEVLAEYDAKNGAPAKLEVKSATINGTPIQLRNDPDGQWATATIPLPKEDTIDLKIDADRPVRWQLTAQSIRNFQSEGGTGVRTLFRWEVQNEAGAWEELDRAVKPGEPVRCTAVVWGDAVTDLVSVRMPIPAGFEVVEFEPSDGRQEVRAGALTYFTQLADSRPKSFRFFLRAETDGTLKVVPATVEVVRRPDRRGWSGPMTVTVQGG